MSLFFVFLFLLAFVFVRLEERRLVYEIQQTNGIRQKLLEEKRMKTLVLAKSTRPQQIEKLAQKKLPMRRVQPGQVILLSGDPSSLNGVSQIGDGTPKNTPVIR
jgi:cell division protein FtsL